MSDPTYEKFMVVDKDGNSDRNRYSMSEATAQAATFNAERYNERTVAGQPYRVESVSDPTYEYRVVSVETNTQWADHDRRADAEQHRSALREQLSPQFPPLTLERRLVGVWERVEGDK